MRSLRIVDLLPFCSPRFGGSVEQQRLFAGELVRRGHQVRLLSTDLGGPPVQGSGAWSEVAGVPVFRARAGWLHAAPPYRPPPALVAALQEVLPTADLVAGHVGLTLLNVVAARRCARAGVPFVYAAQGALQTDRLRRKGWRKALFLRCCERPLLRRAALLRALTAAEAADFRRNGAPAERIAVVPNGIVPAEYQGGDGAAMRAAWGLPAGAAVVLFLGRLAPEKGLDLLLLAAAPLLAADPDRWLVLAGPDDGEAARVRRQAVQLGVGGRVLLPGPVPPEGRAAALAAADVFALTSRSEGLPLAPLEAAAAGLPLLLTAGCNLPEVAAAGAGTVDPPDAAALRASLQRLLADVDLRRRCAQNARRMVEQQFALPAVAALLEARYLELVR